MPNALTDLSVEFVSLVDRAAVRDPQDPTQPQRFLLTKSEIPIWKAESGAPASADTSTIEGGPVPDIDDVRAELAKAEQERDQAREAAEKADSDRKALEAKVAELEKADDNVEPEEIDKSELSEPVRAALEKAEAIAKAADERIAKAEEIAKTERDLRITREFVAKAENEYPHVGGSPAEFGPVLKSMAEKLSKDEFALVEQRLKATNAQLAKSAIFEEMGRGGEPQHSDSQTGLVAKAEELRKADSSLSEAKAMERAMQENPELASQYLDTVR